jgi:hypothetical protein
MSYKFHEDPGHGWLAVPMAELVELGVAHQISGYSYVSRDGLTAYLEEDCDMSIFLRAKGVPIGGLDAFGVKYSHTNSDSFIRSLRHFPAREAA